MPTPPTFTTGAVLTAAQMNTIGMHLVTSATFSGTGAVTLNNVFTADYTNYRVIFNITNTNKQETYCIRLRAGGVDTATNYSSVGTWTYLSGGSGFNNVIAGQAATYMIIGSSTGSAAAGGGIIDFFGPQVNSYTRIHSEGSAVTNNTGHENYSMTGTHYLAYQADGFNIIGLNSLLLTGSICVYGMRN